MQRQFVSDVSHELRTPLTTVRMAGDVLHDARDQLRPGDRARRRAAAGRARPVRDAARRPARDQPVRRRRRGARPGGRQPGRRRPPGGRRDRAAGGAARRPGRRASPTARASPRPTYAGSSGSCATWSPTRSTTRRDSQRATTSRCRVAADEHAAALTVRDHGVGLAAGPDGDGLQPVLAGRPGPGPDHRRHRSGAGDLAGGRPAARRPAAGLGPPGEGAQFRLTLPRRAGDPIPHSPLPLVPDDVREAASMSRRVAARRRWLARRSCWCSRLRAAAHLGAGAPRPQTTPRRRRTSPPSSPRPVPRGRLPDEIVSGFLPRCRRAAEHPVARSSSPPTRRPAGSPTGDARLPAPALDAVSGGSRVQLGDAQRLDSRGGWRAAGPATRPARPAAGPDNGEWRIQNPPDALVVPASYFEQRYTPVYLYFFDQSDRVLVPDRVYLPRGEQPATPLVRGAARRPGADSPTSRRTAFPAAPARPRGAGHHGRRRRGAAQRRGAPADADRARPGSVAQLAWTLRQLRGVTPSRSPSVAAPVPLPDGRRDFSVQEGDAFSPTSLAPSDDRSASSTAGSSGSARCAGRV